LLRWKGRVDTFNDGWACSIASVILLSAVNGGKIHAAKASGTMIHEASTVASGTKRDMDKAKSALENAEKNIISVYAQRSGKSEAE
jgi:ATP-dependent protease ClpP protease subunit